MRDERIGLVVVDRPAGSDAALDGSRGRGHITVDAEVVDGAVEIAVKDDGVGLGPDDRARIFEPFYTTKEVGKGTGLGLAITYGIVQEHGGQIIAANHPEGGAVFTVELPIAPSPGR